MEDEGVKRLGLSPAYMNLLVKLDQPYFQSAIPGIIWCCRDFPFCAAAGLGVAWETSGRRITLAWSAHVDPALQVVVLFPAQYPGAIVGKHASEASESYFGGGADSLNAAHAGLSRICEDPAPFAIREAGWRDLLGVVEALSSLTRQCNPAAEVVKLLTVKCASGGICKARRETRQNQFSRRPHSLSPIHPWLPRLGQHATAISVDEAFWGKHSVFPAHLRSSSQ